jgi:hypothetical protein
MIRKSKPYKLFEEIVAQFTLTCHYQFGYWPEIASNLKDLGRDQTLAAARYPFIMVSAGYVENKDIDNLNAISESDLSVYIVDRCPKGLSTLERETQIYDAILYPLKDELFERLKNSPYILTDFGRIEHTCQNMYYLQNMEKNQNQLDDFVDAIEIKIKDFKINKTYVCQ